MAEIWPRTITIDGVPRPIRLVFRSRLVRFLNWLPFVEIGGIVLSAGTVRFKRSPAEIPRSLVAHEIGHVIQAHWLGWRYLPKYLLNRKIMEVEADVLGGWVENGVSSTVERPAWLDRFRL